MVTALDLEPSASVPGTRTAQVLLGAATYPVMMDAIINDRARRHDPLINNLFVHAAPSSASQSGMNWVPDYFEKEPDEFDNESVRDHSAQDAVEQSMGVGRVTSVRSESGELATGVIVSLPHGKNCGFIEPTGGGNNLFFHATWVEQCFFSDLQVGDPVCFVVSETLETGVRRRLRYRVPVRLAVDRLSLPAAAATALIPRRPVSGNFASLVLAPLLSLCIGLCHHVINLVLFRVAQAALVRAHRLLRLTRVLIEPGLKVSRLTNVDDLSAALVRDPIFASCSRWKRGFPLFPPPWPTWAVWAICHSILP